MPRCDQQECPLLKNGKCLEGKEPPSKCPHYSADIDIIEPNNEEIPDPSDKSQFYDGRVIPLNEINRIALSNPTKLIILAGMTKSGKTTLLLSLLHLFETTRSFGGFIFGGSETLISFEEFAHESRVESQSLLADTPRTNVTDEPINFLHLKIAPEVDPTSIQDVVFTDVSGEQFKKYRDSTAQCKNFYICKRADHFALFFDSDSLSNKNTRATTRVSALTLMKSLVEAGVLTSQTNIQIVFSRWDLYQAKNNKESFENYFQKLKDELQKLYGQNFKISFFEIASRPQNYKILEFGYGIDKLLIKWMQDGLQDNNLMKSLAKYSGTRQFLLY